MAAILASGKPSMINIQFSRITGTKKTSTINLPITREKLKTLLIELFGSADYRLTVKGEELTLDNEENFNKNVGLIENNTMIYVLQRMKGGSKMVDIDTQRAAILNELPDELDKVPTDGKQKECPICMVEDICYNSCCVKMCKQCFIRTFIQCEYKFKCSICGKILDYQKFFVTSSFIISLEQLDETAALARNIDFQICTCGVFAVNDTMYSQQQCNDCKRRLCFFCNEDWNDAKMKNQKYTCGYNCKWENYLTYQLVPSGYNKDLKIPNRRVCPKCKICGTKDDRCKFHTCPSCGHTFCFICLKPERGQTVCPTAYNQPCTDIIKQDYKVFPRVGQNEE